MSRPANALAPVLRNDVSRRALRVLFLASAGALIAQTLAGYFFLWSIDISPRQATPLTTLRYFYHYGARDDVRSRILLCSALSVGLVLVGTAAALWPRPRALYGDARFARGREMAEAGLLGDEGIVLGEVGRRYLMLPGQQGVALAAPPRSGKGVGVVIPNLLNWPGSVVCVDVKRENWTITAGYRASTGQPCFLFDPLAEDGRTARWNPLAYVSAQPDRRVNDIQRIASMLYPEVLGSDPFWIASARSLFLGISLYLFETPSLPKTIGEVLRQGMASDDEGFGHHWKRVVEGRNRGRMPLTGECVRALYDVIDLAPVTASSIRKTFTSRLDLWLNPILDRATAQCDFDLRDLRRRPMSIYVAVNPDDLHRLRPVLSLFFEQAIGLQTRTLPEHDPTLVHPVMMLLDECPALGRIPILAESIAYVPGYNVRVVMVCQAPSQLREVYGAENTRTMLKSLGARIVYAPKDYDDAKEISDELGMTTVRVRSRSHPQLGFWNTKHTRGANITVSEQRRPLLLAQEVKELKPQEEIIFAEGLRPILAKKIRYFADPRFRARLLPPPASAASLECAADERVTGQVSMVEGENMALPLDDAPRTGARAGEEARSATVEDLDRLDQLTLDDFACDFSRVELPTHDGAWTAGEMQTAVNSFLSTLEEK